LGDFLSIRQILDFSKSLISNNSSQVASINQTQTTPLIDL